MSPAPMGQKRKNVPTSEILTVDHRIDHISRANSLEGEPVHLFVRERWSSAIADKASSPVVLFLHGGTYPSVTDFDLDFEDYSWMAYLAERGFHVFAMDCVGYGGSSRTWLDDPRYLTADQKPLLRRPQAASEAVYPPGQGNFLRSPQSDWTDMHAVVSFIRDKVGVGRINLVGWSGGGPRAGGYASLHPDMVDKLVLLAPAYDRNSPDTELNLPGAKGQPLRITTRETFEAAWDREVKRADQFDPEVRHKLWTTNIEFDPVGASWTPQVMRSPNLTWESVTRGWNREMVSKISAPTLLIAMEWDTHVAPRIVDDLFADLNVEKKVLATVQSASHYIPWERDHSIVQDMSASWLESGTVAGMSRGAITIAPRSAR